MTQVRQSTLLALILATGAVAGAAHDVDWRRVLLGLTEASAIVTSWCAVMAVGTDEDFWYRRFFASGALMFSLMILVAIFPVQ